MCAETEQMIQDAGRLIEPSEFLRPRTLESAHRRQWFESLRRGIIANAMVVMVALSAISVSFAMIRDDMDRRSARWNASNRVRMEAPTTITSTPWQYADAFWHRSERVRRTLGGSER